MGGATQNTTEAQREEERVWLVGLRFDGESEEPDLYTLVFSDRDHGPIVSRERLLFFSDVALAPKAIALDDDAEIRELDASGLELEVVYDVAQACYLLSSEDFDDSASILNCLNGLFDFVRTADLEIPPWYRQPLYDLADHLTFSKEYGSWIERSSVQRETYLNGLIWCVGAVMTRSTVMRA
jgi:hypothetical protein